MTTPMRAGPSPARAWVRPRRRRGFTLVEVLVALTLTAIVASALLAMVRSGGRVGAHVGARAEAGQAGLLATSLLRFEIERAGRRHGGLTLRLDPSGAGGDRIAVRYRAEAHRAEPVDVDAAFFAAVDSAGRPNLYRQPPGASRQPWLLGVTGVHVLGAIDEAGHRVDRAALIGTRRWTALDVEVRFHERPAERFTALTARAGEVVAEVAP